MGTRRSRDPEARELTRHLEDVLHQVRRDVSGAATALCGADVEACFVTGAERAAPAILKRLGRELTNEGADLIGVYLLTVMREAIIGLDRPRLEAFERALEARETR